MSDRLKKFVGEHRQEFDTNEPNKNLWNKIDAQMGVKNSSRISSNWLSKFIYLSFSVSILIVAIYFISENLNNTSKNELVLNRKGSVVSNSEQHPNANQNKFEVNVNENITKGANDLSNNKNESQNPIRASSKEVEQGKQSTNDNLMSGKKDSVPVSKPFENNISASKEIKSGSLSETKNEQTAGKSKKTEIYIPAEPEKMNSYTGTLYEGSSICSILSAYKFYGKIKLDQDRVRNTIGFKETMKTVSCSRLENMENIKAVWLKGKTDKPITLTLKQGFNNILLVKSDGRKLSPEGISHYYAGRGVIMGYKGKNVDMIFKDKVELILFFKDIEEGDKIIIDGIIEAVVKKFPRFLSDNK